MTAWIEKHLSRWMILGILLEIIVLALAYVEADGDWLYFFRSAARLSGRVSLLFFSLSFVYITLNPGFERTLVSTKYRLNLNFAIIHMIHWFFLATAIYLNDFIIPIPRLIPGFLAYVVIVCSPLVFKSFSTNLKLLKLIQNSFLYLPWTVFFLTYLTRLTGNAPSITGQMAAYIPLMIYTVGLLIWHLIYRFGFAGKK